MTDGKESKPDSSGVFNLRNVASLTSTLQRTLDAAKRGERDPGQLSDEEIKLVCRTLLIQYAQMGIS